MDERFQKDKIMEQNDIDFRDLLDEYREEQRDGWDDEDEDVISDGLDPGFSSWADYYHYMYG